MQHEIIAPLDLLDNRGRLVEEGWARRPYWRYDRERIKAARHRIKEWDYYSVLSQDGNYGLTVTVADLGFGAICSLCWLDFTAGSATQLDTTRLFTRGSIGLPSSSAAGKTMFTDRTMSIACEVRDFRRFITVDAPGFRAPDGGRGLSASLILDQNPRADSMAIATSWAENRRAFYYNHKINCMPAAGSVNLGGRTYDFKPASAFGSLDWGRGYWTWRNRWYWGSASGLLKGEPFGWNIGYGFSDRSPATENLLFYRGRAHKLDQVSFHIDTRNYLKPWRFTSNDGRFEMDFRPVVDRHSSLNLVLLKSIQHQVFGYFTGSVVLDDGTRLAVTDFLGFAEDVLNWL